MKTFLTSMALVLAAGPALALSCLRPDVARTYSQASEAEQAYVVVAGALRFDEGRLPENDGTNQDRRTVAIPARLEGKSLSRAGVHDAVCAGHHAGSQLFRAVVWRGAVGGGVPRFFGKARAEAGDGGRPLRQLGLSRAVGGAGQAGGDLHGRVGVCAAEVRGGRVGFHPPYEVPDRVRDGVSGPRAAFTNPTIRTRNENKR